MTRPRSSPTCALRWSASAVADLEAILDWLDTAGMGKSLEFEHEVLAALEPLRRYPRMGRVPRDFDWRIAGFEALREVLVWDYRVGYVIEAE